MLDRQELLRAVEVELAYRDQQEREVEFPKYDWYGPDCDCPPEGRKVDGSCPTHKRARESQTPPPDPWEVWYLEAGRGFGKTETGAQFIRSRVERNPPGRRVALVAPTAADVRDVMVEGASGLLNVCPPWNRPEYQPSKRRIVWPNGSMAFMYSADEPERLRGPQHHDAWCDEIAAWRVGETAWDMLMFGLRLGHDPRAVVTTTPKPHDWLRKIKRRAGTFLTKGSTYENRAHLAATFFSSIITKYEGSRLGRQELEGLDLEDTPGALWNAALLDELRIARADLPDFERVVVGVDPSVADPKLTADETTAKCGIVVVGMAHMAHPTLGWVPYSFVLADRSLKAHPKVWGEAVVDAYREFEADLVVAEVNNGGALVESVIHTVDPNLPYKQIHASRGKQTRAEPVATLYSQRRSFHVVGDETFPVDLSTLESQMCNWVPGMKSPDEMDALVWAQTEVMIELAGIVEGPNPWPGWRG